MKVPHRGQETLDPLDLELGVVVSFLLWVLATEPGSSQEQQALLTTEPSL